MPLSRLLLVAALFAPLAGISADENAPSPNVRQMLRARIEQEAEHPTAKPAEPVTPTAKAAAAASESSPLLVSAPPPAESAPTPTAATTNQEAKKAPPTVLPKVEVNKGRITKLDQDLAKEDQQIAREKKNTKVSDVDQALNNAKTSKVLSIFGGQSAQYRQQVASERVSLMEDEKDLIEAIAHAKTKEEKAKLQTQLDALREERRELEKAMR